MQASLQQCPDPPGTYEMGTSSINTGNVTGLSGPYGRLRTIYSWGIGAQLGSSSNIPITPTILDPNFFGFDRITNEEIVFFDPDFATGYEYTTDDVPFSSGTRPDILPGGDNIFELLIGNDVYPLVADQEFDFKQRSTVRGYKEFIIRGIDITEQLDPDNPLAFVTGINFVEGGQLSSFHQCPRRCYFGPRRRLRPRLRC